MASRLVAALFAVFAVGIATESFAQDICGDANLDGRVDDTDAVLVFRRAANLSSSAVNKTSDVDLDGAITQTDAIRILRLAAGLPENVSCQSSQVENVSNRSSAILRIGAAAIPGGARSAQSTIPCADGGFRVAGPTSEEHVDCNQNGLVTNGVITFDDDPENQIFRDSYSGFSLFDVATFENLIITGLLAYDFSGEDSIQVEGTLDASSNVLGSFSDQYVDMELDNQFVVIEADLITTVFAGLGAFANINWIRYILLESDVEDLQIEYTNGEFERTVFGDGLCDRCSNHNQCADDMFCFPCLENCGGTPQACSVDFVNLNCGPPGTFGPPELCVPCSSDGQCGDVLSCFPCNSGCTGSTNRCSSNVLFVNCVDGSF